jgi:hypothetical protein
MKTLIQKRPIQCNDNTLPILSKPILMFPSDLKVISEFNNVRSRKLKIDLDSEVDGVGVYQSFILFLRTTSDRIAWTKFAIIGNKIEHEIQVYSIGKILISMKNLHNQPVMVTTRILI